MITITPQTYHNNSQHRSIADAAMDAAEVQPNDVREIRQIAPHLYELEIWNRDNDGNIEYSLDGQPVTTTIKADTIPPKLLWNLPVLRTNVISFREVQKNIWSVEVHDPEGTHPTKFIIVHTGA